MAEPATSQRSSGPPSAPATTAPTQTQTQTQPRPEGSRPRVLRLRGQHTSTGRSVQWAEDVVDNEGLGRKSSKVCCIYHKPRAVDESSDEDSSSSSSDSEAESGEERRGKAPACGHGHGHGREGGGARREEGKGGGDEKKKKRAPGPNAYEKVPRQNKAGS